MTIKRPVSNPLARAFADQNLREKAFAMLIGVGIALALGVALA